MAIFGFDLCSGDPARCRIDMPPRRKAACATGAFHDPGRVGFQGMDGHTGRAQSALASRDRRSIARAVGGALHPVAREAREAEAPRPAFRPGPVLSSAPPRLSCRVSAAAFRATGARAAFRGPAVSRWYRCLPTQPAPDLGPGALSDGGGLALRRRRGAARRAAGAGRCGSDPGDHRPPYAGSPEAICVPNARQLLPPLTRSPRNDLKLKTAAQPLSRPVSTRCVRARSPVIVEGSSSQGMVCATPAQGVVALALVDAPPSATDSKSQPLFLNCNPLAIPDDES